MGNHPFLRILVAAAISGAIVTTIWAFTRKDTERPSSRPGPEITVTVRPSSRPSRPPRPSPTAKPKTCDAILAELRSENTRIRTIVEGVNDVAGNHPERVPAARYRRAARALASIEDGLDGLRVPPQLAGLRQLEATIARLARQAYETAVDQLKSGGAVTLPGLSTQTDVIFSAIDTALSQPLCS
ncbi:MAG: hypothetical protein ABR600_11760 [Actinomycetota bacterium]